MSTPTGMLAREHAVEVVADCIRRRMHYVVVGAPSLVSGVMQRLSDQKHTWSAFVESAAPVILVTNEEAVVEVMTMLAGPDSHIIVLTVPKSVPASVLADIVGQPVPADGSQDLFVLSALNEQIQWPVLFIDALDEVDPVAASQIRAAEAAPNR